MKDNIAEKIENALGPLIDSCPNFDEYYAEEYKINDTSEVEEIEKTLRIT